jgi:hypothetical protein
MKTTLELPDGLFKRAKSVAAERGIPFRELVTEALSEKLSAPPKRAKPWMKSFGALRNWRKETARIQHLIDTEFEHIELEDWR